MFVHTHSSSRFDRDLTVFERAIHRYMVEADLLTLTEVSKEAREKVLRHRAAEENWGVITGDLSTRDDCAIMYDKDIWKVRYSETHEVSRRTWRIFGHQSKPVAAVFGVLEHLDTGKRILVSVCHLPSSVEGKHAKPASVAAWRAARRGWQKRWNRLAKVHEVDGVLVCGDWNVNIKRKFYQTMFKLLQPGMKPTLDYRRMPVRGTHGHRLIDFTFIRGDVVTTFRPVVYAPDRSSDHGRYKEGLKFTHLTHTRA
jgi:hypothetical protein